MTLHNLNTVNNQVNHYVTLWLHHIVIISRNIEVCVCIQCVTDSESVFVVPPSWTGSDCSAGLSFLCGFFLAVFQGSGCGTGIRCWHASSNGISSRPSATASIAFVTLSPYNQPFSDYFSATTSSCVLRAVLPVFGAASSVCSRWCCCGCGLFSTPCPSTVCIRLFKIGCTAGITISASGICLYSPT